MWKQDTFGTKMRKKHQHNSSHFPTGKCQMLYVVKLWATWSWVWLSWALPKPKGTMFPPWTRTLSTTLTARVLKDHVKGLGESPAWPPQILVVSSRAGLSFDYWHSSSLENAYYCRARKECFRLYFVPIPPSGEQPLSSSSPTSPVEARIIWVLWAFLLWGKRRQELWRRGDTPQLDSGSNTRCQMGASTSSCRHLTLPWILISL